MKVLITGIRLGGNITLVDVYSDSDGFITPIEVGVTKNQLISGHLIKTVPEDATIVKVVSTGNCDNSTDITL